MYHNPHSTTLLHDYYSPQQFDAGIVGEKENILVRYDLCKKNMTSDVVSFKHFVIFEVQK